MSVIRGTIGTRQLWVAGSATICGSYERNKAFTCEGYEPTRELPWARATTMIAESGAYKPGEEISSFVNLSLFWEQIIYSLVTGSPELRNLGPQSLIILELFKTVLVLVLVPLLSSAFPLAVLDRIFSFPGLRRGFWFWHSRCEYSDFSKPWALYITLITLFDSLPPGIDALLPPECRGSKQTYLQLTLPLAYSLPLCYCAVLRSHSKSLPGMVSYMSFIQG